VPRAIVAGNGRLYIGIDYRGTVRELYYPYIGQPNHITGQRNRLGLYCEEGFLWLDDPDWERSFAYEDDTLVGVIGATSPRLGLQVSWRSGVHHLADVAVFEVTVTNQAPRRREVRLMYTLDLTLMESDIGDTVQFDPICGGVVHYKRDVAFLLAARTRSGPLFQYSCGKKRQVGVEGTWRDAEDGCLEGNPVSHGAVDSTVSMRAWLEPGAMEVFHLVLCAARSMVEARRLAQWAGERGAGTLLDEIGRYWRSWVRPAIEPWPAGLSDDVRRLCARSLLTIVTHIDARGGPLAAVDSDILLTNRDHYGYIWPRDAGFIIEAMLLAGYTGIARRFFGYARRLVHDEGYLYQKYNPDGTVGSTWHPLLLDGEPQLPIQEDEAALVLHALGVMYADGGDRELVREIYPDLVRPMADFLLRHRQEATGLPLPSYDLWEERWGVFTFTAAAVYRGLCVASRLAHDMGEASRAAELCAAAGRMRDAVLEHLYSREMGRFRRGLYYDREGAVYPDETLDSSIVGTWLLGMLPVNSPEVESTMVALRRGLWVGTDVGGLARYSGDYYFRRGDDFEAVPGNPWFVCTMWLAQYHICRADGPAGLEAPAALLDWAAGRAGPTMILSEQLDPYTGGPLSVAPLTWSHAAVVTTVERYRRRCRQPATGMTATESGPPLEGVEMQPDGSSPETVAAEKE